MKKLKLTEPSEVLTETRVSAAQFSKGLSPLLHLLQRCICIQSHVLASGIVVDIVITYTYEFGIKGR